MPDDPKPTPPADPNGPPAPPTDPPKPPDPPKSFTQAQLDQIVQERLRTEKAKFADYEDLKKAKTKLDGIEAAQKTELEREQEKATAAETRAAAAEARARATSIRAAVVDAATKAGAIAPADVLSMLPADSVTVTDDGTVEGADAAVAAVLETRPYMKSPTRPGGSVDSGARGGTATGFKDAPAEDFQAELAKHGLRSRA